MTNCTQPDQTKPVDDLVKAAHSDGIAFGKLFDHFYPPIFAYCARRLIVRAVAEDVASEVFLKVATNIRGFSGTTAEDFRRWLYRIATNEINSHLRQSIRRRDLLEAAARMGLINTDVSTKLVEADSPIPWSDVYLAIDELTEREQSIVALRFFGGLQHKEIAGILNAKAGTIRVALNRALNKLRDRLQNGKSCRRPDVPNDARADAIDEGSEK